MIVLFERNDISQDYYFHEIERQIEEVILIPHPLQKLKGLKWLLYRVHTSVRVNRRINLPFKSIWAKFYIEKSLKEIIKKAQNPILFFSGDHYGLEEIGFFDYIKGNFPNAKLCYELADIVPLYEKDYKYFSINKLKEKFDVVFTFNKIDAQKYNFILSKPCIPSYDNITKDNRIANSDIFFVGRDKGRLNEIISVFEVCSKNGLKCEFYIMGVPHNRQRYSNHIHYNIRLDYLDVLKFVRKTKCVLNIVQSNSDGLTLRDYEAIGMGKLLISNRKIDEKYNLHCNKGIIALDSLNKNIEKLKNVADVKWTGKEVYNAASWFKWINEVVNEQCFN